jgi:TolB-like protein
MMAVPTLAVLPFTAADDEPDVGGEARAFSDEVATEVGRCYLATMLSVKPGAVRSGEAADLKAVGRRLGVRYLLLGRLGRDGPEHAVTVRLVEAETGRELWERPFRYTPGERTARAVGIALGAIWFVLLSETGHPLPAVPEAGHYAIHAFVSMKDLPTSASLAGKALEIDRNWVPALLAYAWAQVMLGSDDPPEAQSARLAKAYEAVERAIELAPLNPLAHHRLGQVLRERGDPFGAISANQQALKLNPNMSIAHVDIGMNKIDAGLAHETIPHIVDALRMSPIDRWRAKWYLWAGQAAVHTGDYDTAVSWLRKAMLSDFQHIALRYRDVKPWLALAYAGLGREEEGRALLIEEARERGALTIAAWRQRYPRGSGTLARQRERIEGLLRRLGVPEGKMETGAVR